jgi:hypothetical protein
MSLGRGAASLSTAAEAIGVASAGRDDWSLLATATSAAAIASPASRRRLWERER